MLKYDPRGLPLARRSAGRSSIRLNAAGTDAAGNVYVTGAVAGKATIGKTALDVPTDPAEPTLDYPDALVVSLDPGGAVRWVKTFGNQFIQRGHRIAVDPGGATYIAGVSWEPGRLRRWERADRDVNEWWSFFLKLDSAGNVVWVYPVDTAISATRASTPMRPARRWAWCSSRSTCSPT